MEFERAVIIANPRGADYNERVQGSNVRSTHTETVKAVLAQVDAKDRVAMAAWYAKENNDRTQLAAVELDAVIAARRLLRRKFPGEDQPHQTKAEALIGKDAAAAVTVSRMNPSMRCTRCHGRGVQVSRKTGEPKPCDRCGGKGTKRLSKIKNRLWGIGITGQSQEPYREVHAQVVADLEDRMGRCRDIYRRLMRG